MGLGGGRDCIAEGGQESCSQMGRVLQKMHGRKHARAAYLIFHLRACDVRERIVQEKGLGL